MLLVGPRNSHDITMAHALIDQAGRFETLLADLGYDANPLRQRLARQGATAVIPGRSRRKASSSHDPVLYRQRNTLERLWARLKDYRRAATRSASSPPTSSPASSSQASSSTGPNDSGA